MSSPRRTRKWFGLFSKTSSSKSSNFDDASSASSTSHSLYTKKNNHSPHQQLRREISGPTRSQSEYRLHDIQRQQEKQQPTVRRSESFSSTTSDRSSLLSLSQQNVTAPLATPESEYETNLSDADSISLMSAIVSVTAKYINLDDSQRYLSPTPPSSATPPASNRSGVSENNTKNSTPVDSVDAKNKPLFAVGQPSDFRRLGDDELLIEPPRTLSLKMNSLGTSEPDIMESSPVPPVLAPYSSHRRGAPSNDSGYLSQASTLNRPSVTSTPFTLDKQQYVSEADTPSDPPSARISSGGDVFASPVINAKNNSFTDYSPSEQQYDYGTASPVTYTDPFSPEQRKSLRNSGRSKRLNTGDDVPVKRIRSLSPDTYNVNVTTAAITPPEENNSNERQISAYQKSVDKEILIEPLPVTNLEHSTTFNKDVDGKDSPIIRPSTLNVMSHYVNTTELSSIPPSSSSYNNDEKTPVVVNNQMMLSEKVSSAGPNSIMSRLTRSKSIGTPASLLKHKDNAPVSPLCETVFGPRELFYKESNNDKLNKQDSARSSSPITSSRSVASPAKTPTRTHFSFTRSQSLSARAELRRRHYNNESSASSSFDNSISSPSSSFNNRSFNDSTDAPPPVVLRHAKSRDNIRSSSSPSRGKAESARRLSVRERAAAFGQVTTSPVASPCRTSWNERAYEGFDTGAEEMPPTDSGSRRSINFDDDRNSSSISGENVDPNPYTPRLQQINSNSCTDVSAREFDLRCRVDEHKQITSPSSRYSSTPRLDSLRGVPMTRSTDRLVRASQTRQNERSSRPKSEVIARFEFRSFDNKIEEPVRSYSLSRNIEKEQLNEHEPLYKSSKSENQSATELSLTGKKIGNFPLTLRTGSSSAHSSRVSIDGKLTRSSNRPRSMYENEQRKSIYDNERRSLYDNVSYEMV